MKEIKVGKDETLESAYARLKEAQFKLRQDVYMYYNGKKIVSNQTLNEAYKDVFGSTKVDLEERERQKQIAALEEEEDTRAYIYTPEDVVRDIIVSELIDKKDVNENWVSSVADSYLAGMYMYTKYCKEVTIENWIETISGYVHNIRKKDPEDNKKYLYTDEEIIAHLDFYEKLGNILKAVTKETP